MAGLNPAPSNQIQDFLTLVVRKRWWIILPTLAGVTAGLVVLDFVPKKYEAWTRIEINEVRFDDDPNLRNPQAVPFKVGLQHAPAQVLATPNLRKVVGEKLRWEEFLGLSDEKQKEYFDLLRKRTSVVRAPKEKDAGPDYVTISFKDESPRRAADFSNAIRDVWQEDTKSNFSDQVKRDLDELRKQVSRAKTSVDLARHKKSEWEQQYDLPRSTTFDRRLSIDEDPITAKWNKLNTEAETVRREVDSAKVALGAAMDRYASEPSTIERPAGEIPKGSEAERKLQEELSKLRTEHYEFEKKLREYKPAHPKYSILQGQIADNEKSSKELEVKLGQSAAPAGDKHPKDAVINPDKAKYRDEVDKAADNVKALQQRLVKLQEDLKALEPKRNERARVYERYRNFEGEERIADQNYVDKSLQIERKTNLLAMIESPAGNPYRVTDYAVPSDKPVEPNIGFILAAAIFAGAGVGIGLLFVAEFTRPSFRSLEDAVASLPVPVLGGVGRIVTMSELRRERFRRAIGIGASLAALGLIATVASAYLVNPDLLPRPVHEVMDAMKEKLR